MKKSLSDKLTRYGSLVAGIAGTAAVQGQPQYFPGPNVTIEKDSLVFIDLNHDSINDFAIRSRFDFSIGISSFDEISALPLSNTTNRVAGTTPLNYPYAAKIDLNVDIDANTDWLGPLVEGSLSFARNGNFDYNDFWNGGADGKFLGFRFLIGDSIHFGWARLDVAADGKSYAIKGYAYNQKPLEPISTGYMVSVNKQNPMAFIVSRQGNSIWIKADVLQQTATVEMFDLNGKVVYTNRINPQEEQTISTTPFSAGMYILRFFNENGLVERKVMITR
ncbi:MAG: T9SS type A sorting domain-containing protein [Cryomorphaceae bacterium]|nr:T9SS type A sorting domain-containing protein [Cryomorphaceae bacterium]